MELSGRLNLKERKIHSSCLIGESIGCEVEKLNKSIISSSRKNFTHRAIKIHRARSESKKITWNHRTSSWRHAKEERRISFGFIKHFSRIFVRYFLVSNARLFGFHRKPSRRTKRNSVYYLCCRWSHPAYLARSLCARWCHKNSVHLGCGGSVHSADCRFLTSLFISFQSRVFRLKVGFVLRLLRLGMWILPLQKVQLRMEKLIAN